MNHICSTHSYAEAVVHGSNSQPTNPTSKTPNKTPKTTTDDIQTEIGGVKETKKCNNCGLVLNKSADLVAHIVTMHGFNYSGPIKNKHYPMKHQVLSPNQERPTPLQARPHVQPDGLWGAGEGPSLAEFKCFDCSNKFSSKHELHEHKRQAHSKQKLCSYFHGNGRGCKFPANECFNIHNENITPTIFENTDFRSRIPCKHGDSCTFHQRGVCFYLHAPNVKQGSSTRSGSRNINNETTEKSSNEAMMMSALFRMNRNLETLSERLQFLDVRSMQDFPNLENNQKRT